MHEVEQILIVGATALLLYASTTLTAFLALLLFSRPGARLRRSLARGRRIRRDELSGMAWLALLWLPVAVVFGVSALKCRSRECC